MQTKTLPRLVLVMFFQLFSQGAFSPVLSMYLQDFLGFGGGQTGAILAGAVITSLLAPVLALYVIDRLADARTLLMLCHAGMAVIATALGFTRGFVPFLVLYILYMALAGPGIGLVNALAFHHVPGGNKAFGGLRLWGTVGWIASSWAVGLLWMLLPKSGLAVFAGNAGGYPLIWGISVLGSLVTIVSAMGLPRETVRREGRPKFIPPATRAIFRKPDIVILCAVYLLSSILDRFYTYGTAPFFLSLGIPRPWVMPLMTLGQITEVFVLLGLQPLLRRFRFRQILVWGMAIQVLRFVLYTFDALPPAIAGVSLNGFIFAWVYTCITMYIDSHTGPAERAGVHQILVFVFSGVSSLLGNLAAGWLRDLAPSAGGGWHLFWMVPSVAGGAVFLLVLLFRLVAPPAQPGSGGSLSDRDS